MYARWRTIGVGERRLAAILRIHRGNRLLACMPLPGMVPQSDDATGGVAEELSMRLRWPQEAPAALASLVAGLPRRAIAVDCVANIGTVAAALARRCSQVIAFEPNPVAFGALERRLGRARNVQLIPAAVGAYEGRRNLFLHVDHDTDPLSASIGSSLHPGKSNVSPRFLEVDVVDLDMFLGRLDQPVDLLKLDVEGTEVEILERLLETGRLEAIGRVVVEMHDGVIPDLAERGARLRERLAAAQYRHVSLDWE